MNEIATYHANLVFILIKQCFCVENIISSANILVKHLAIFNLCPENSIFCFKRINFVEIK